MIHTVGPAAVLSYALGGLLVVLVMRMLGEMATASPALGSFMELRARGARRLGGLHDRLAVLVLLGRCGRFRSRSGRQDP
ncbi:hypothetical protein [Amycolatopsis sp. NPDC059657]|uniref:hypothetical protein n=1 Tax=Amycolatopsis sp. NPDC059657 TaxID=3346899 RepID=UPI00366BCC36